MDNPTPKNGQWVRITFNGEEYDAHYYERHNMLASRPGYSVVVPNVGLWFIEPERVQEWKPMQGEEKR